MAQEKKSLHLDPLTIVLGIAAIFAIGSIGFFLATYLESISAPSVGQIHVTVNPTLAQKQQLLAGLSATSTATSTTNSASAASNSGPTTAQKLKLLEELNSQ